MMGADMEQSLPILDTDYVVAESQQAQYRRDGFIQLDGVFAGADLEQLRHTVASAVAAEQNRDWMGRESPATEKPTKTAYEQIFIQKVNLWTRHPDVKPFVLCRRLGNLAARL